MQRGGIGTAPNFNEVRLASLCIPEKNAELSGLDVAVESEASSILQDLAQGVRAGRSHPGCVTPCA
jgi:hypothetical protein